jgi:hypothetical protein
MGKGKRRQEQLAAKEQNTLHDLQAHKGLSKYQRKKLEQKGIDMSQFGGL